MHQDSSFSANLSQVGFLVLCSFLDCNHVALAVFCVSAATGLSAGYVPGFMTSMAFIAPQYTATVRAMGSFMSQSSGVIAPYMVGAIAKDGTQSEWQIVFFIIAGCLLVCDIIFLLFGSGGSPTNEVFLHSSRNATVSGEMQPWATQQATDLADEPKGDVSYRPNEYMEGERIFLRF